MTTPLDQTRAEFEAHRLEKTGREAVTWDKEYERAGLDQPTTDPLLGRYVLREDQAAWEAWQAAIASRDARIADLEARNEHLSKSWDESLYQGLVAAAKSDVLADLLRDALGPLEVSAAVIESDDTEQMDDLISRIKAALTATDQARANLTPPTAAEAAKES